MHKCIRTNLGGTSFSGPVHSAIQEDKGEGKRQELGLKQNETHSACWVRERGKASRQQVPKNRNKVVVLFPSSLSPSGTGRGRDKVFRAVLNIHPFELCRHAQPFPRELPVSASTLVPAYACLPRAALARPATIFHIGDRKGIIRLLGPLEAWTVPTSFCWYRR